MRPKSFTLEISYQNSYKYSIEVTSASVVGNVLQQYVKVTNSQYI